MNWFKKKRVFLDYAGGEDNPSGIHEEGRAAKKRLEEARAKIAWILKCQARDVVFTSGGTESDNLAVLGVFEAARENFAQPHIIISENEHPAVLESAREAERKGAELTIAPVEQIISRIKESTVLVSIIYAESETGRINPVPKLARLIKEMRKKSSKPYPYIHTDATQAYEHLEVDINKVPADLITLGRVLLVRPNVKIRPLLLGGGQERGLRSGTEDVTAAEEFADDLSRFESVREAETERLKKLQRIFIEGAGKIPGAVINTPQMCLPSIVSVSFRGKLHEFLAVKLDQRGLAASTGSSCDSRKDEPDKEALRFSFGKSTSEREVRDAIRILGEIML